MFKVGDWVRDTSVNNVGIFELKTCAQIEQANIDSSLVKWKPKIGELCVFWDSCDSEYIVMGYTAILCREFDNSAPLEFLFELRKKMEMYSS